MISKKTMSFKSILLYAYNNVNYYHQILTERGVTPETIEAGLSVTELPLLSKEQVQRYSEDLLSNEYKTLPRLDEIVLRRTSGSTGRYLKVIWDRKDLIKATIALWKWRYYWYGITPQMKFCSYHGSIFQRNSIIDIDKQQMLEDGGRNLSFSKKALNKDRIRSDYQMIYAFNPDYLDMQPSIAYLLAQHILEDNKNLPDALKYIELNGEILQNSHRKTITDAFQIEPVEMYGMNEVNAIALECPHHHLHIIDDSVFVEVLKNGEPIYDEVGEIYVTSLLNHAMPFIRYETNDKGKIIWEKCSCGHIGWTLKIDYGRTSDYVILSNGDRINAYTVISIITYTNEFMGNAIKQFQVRQVSVNRIEITLALKPAFRNWQEAIVEEFYRHVPTGLFLDVNWCFHFVEDIFPDKTGKTRSFIPQSVGK